MREVFEDRGSCALNACTMLSDVVSGAAAHVGAKVASMPGGLLPQVPWKLGTMFLALGLFVGVSDAEAQRGHARRGGRTVTEAQVAPARAPLPPGTRFLESMRPGDPASAAVAGPDFDALRRSPGLVEMTPQDLAGALGDCPEGDAPCPFVEELRQRRILLHTVMVAAGAPTDTSGSTRLIVKALLNPGARGTPYLTLDAAPTVDTSGRLDLVSPLFEGRLSEPIADARFGDPLIELGGELIVTLGNHWTQTVQGQVASGYVVRMVGMRVFDRYDGAVIAAWPRGTAVELLMEDDRPVYAQFDPNQLPARDAVPPAPPQPPPPMPNEVHGFPGLSWDDTVQTIGARFSVSPVRDLYRGLFGWASAQTLLIEGYRSRPAARRIGFSTVFQRVYLRFVAGRLETVTGHYRTEMLEGVRGTNRSRMDAEATARMGGDRERMPSPLISDPDDPWECKDVRLNRVCEVYTNSEISLPSPWTCVPPDDSYRPIRHACYRPFDDVDRVLTVAFYDAVGDNLRDERNMGWWHGPEWRAFLVVAAGLSVGFPRIMELRVERVTPTPPPPVASAPAPTDAGTSGPAQPPASPAPERPAETPPSDPPAVAPSG